MRPVAHEVGLEAAIAEREQAVQLTLDHGGRDGGTGESQRGFHVELVLEHGAAPFPGPKMVRVAPALQRSGNLLVPEPLTLHVVQVPEQPAKVGRAETDLQLDLGAVAYAALPPDHLHVPPGG